MSRLFDDAQTQYLKRTEAVVSGEPFAVSCWFNTDSDSLNQTLLYISSSADPWEIYLVVAKGSVAGDPLRIGTYSGGWTSASTTTGFTKNIWHHMTGVFISDASRWIFIDGGSKGTDNTTQVIGTVNTTFIGASVTIGDLMSGKIAEVAIWDLDNWPGVNATAKANNFEKIIPSLAKGFSPLFYPLGLKAYWPLIRDDDNDIVGGYNMTAFNTPSIANHPRIILPHGGN